MGVINLCIWWRPFRPLTCPTCGGQGQPNFIIIAESYFVGARTCVCEVKTTWSGEGKILGGIWSSFVIGRWVVVRGERYGSVAGCLRANRKVPYPLNLAGFYPICDFGHFWTSAIGLNLADSPPDSRTQKNEILFGYSSVHARRTTQAAVVRCFLLTKTSNL